MKDWIVITYDPVDVTTVGSTVRTYVCGRPTGATVVQADGYEAAIEAGARQPGFYDAVPVSNQQPIEMRLVRSTRLTRSDVNGE